MLCSYAHENKPNDEQFITNFTKKVESGREKKGQLAAYLTKLTSKSSTVKNVTDGMTLDLLPTVSRLQGLDHTNTLGSNYYNSQWSSGEVNYTQQYLPRLGTRISLPFTHL